MADYKRTLPRKGCCTPTLCATCGPACGGRQAAGQLALQALAAQAVSLQFGAPKLPFDAPQLQQAMTIAFGGNPLSKALLLGLGPLSPALLGLVLGPPLFPEGPTGPAKRMPRPVGKVRRLMQRAGRPGVAHGGWAERCRRAGWVLADGAWTPRRPARRP